MIAGRLIGKTVTKCGENSPITTGVYDSSLQVSEILEETIPA